ncbi:MAG: GMC family oxidoreductase [Deltaproteobacteria bacterium]|nr:GMC family oxidoreductase [Deltaproteobacteria bacterium]
MSTAASTDAFDTDVLVIGSGFGGSVAALRMAEKGYSVVVLERGKRWTAADFPRSNWNVFKSLWAPAVYCVGALKLTLLDNVFVLSGAGVGGGSLVYANTLLVPPPPFFRDPQWAELSADWQAELAPFYDRAQRMLGAVRNPIFGPADRVLLEVAREMGTADTFKTTDVGVYFGQAGVAEADPYFGGKGPERTGCIRCGACMTGCKHGAKNTLDKNYLHLAERLGARIDAETEAIRLQAIGGPEARGEAGWQVVVRPSIGLGRWFGRRTTLRARHVVLAGGVLGTLPLLMRSRHLGLLPHFPPQLGHKLRTNSEAICGATGARVPEDFSKGIAITSGAYFDTHTHIEVVRYGKGQDALSVLATLLTDGGGRVPRAMRWIGTVLRHPVQFLRSLWKFGWAEHGIILLVMQTLDNSLRAVWRRAWWSPFSPTLRTELPLGQAQNPTYIPIGNEVARRVARKIDGVAMSSVNEVLLDIPTTAHILGGCPIGAAGQGVVDDKQRVHGHHGLWICDGSVMPANLGVNPSLTIAALAEHAMDAVPTRDGRAHEPTVADRVAVVPQA